MNDQEKTPISISVDDGERMQEKWSGAAKEVSEKLPGEHTIAVRGVDPSTGNVLQISSRDAPAAGDDLAEAAMRHVQSLRAVLGFAEGETPEFMPDPTIQQTAAHSIVHLHQHHHGIPIVGMTRSVRFDSKNCVMDVTGSSISTAAAGVRISPECRAADAVKVAAERVAGGGAHAEEGGGEGPRRDKWGQPVTEANHRIDMDGFEPKAIASFSLPNRPTVFGKGPFEDAIAADLVYYSGPNGLQLAWRVGITLPTYSDYVQVMVAADESAEVLAVDSQAHGVAARGRVFTVNPDDGDRELVPFPRSLEDLHALPRLDVDGFPRDWVDDDQTIGNSVFGVNANNNEGLTGQVEDGVVTFDPASGDGVEQQILNEFYFCNVMHDFLYLLGFDEQAGNFQISNFGLGGAGGDPVLARAHPQPVIGTANMLTRPDGTPAVMNMGLPGTGNHTAFDRDVVFHEFVHGLTTRLVGGRLNDAALRGHQSGGMGEGWGDFFALTFHNFSRDAEKTVVGDWFSENPGGIRDFPYDSDYPDGFGNLGTGRFALVFDPRFQAFVAPVHDIGQVWCATLMEMNRRIVAALGDKIRAYRICWAMVTDGLKLTPQRPSFIDARDAILDALDGIRESNEITADEFTLVRRAAWEAFARFGMGADADSLFGDSLNNPAGIRADDSLPAGV